MAKGFVFPIVDPATVDVPSTGTIAVVANLNGDLTVIKSDASINPLVPTNQTSDQIVVSAAASNINIGPGAGVHVAVANVTGTATVRQFSLVKVGLGAPQAGWRIKLVFLFPGQVAGITLQVFDANTLGQNLFSFVTDGNQGSAVADFHFDAAQWQIDDAKVPAVS